MDTWLAGTPQAAAADQAADRLAGADTPTADPDDERGDQRAAHADAVVEHGAVLLGERHADADDAHPDAVRLVRRHAVHLAHPDLRAGAARLRHRLHLGAAVRPGHRHRHRHRHARRHRLTDGRTERSTAVPQRAAAARVRMARVVTRPALRYPEPAPEDPAAAQPRRPDGGTRGAASSAARGGGAPAWPGAAGGPRCAVLLVATLVTLLLGFAQKSPCADGAWTGYKQYTHMCYSDVVPLWSDERLDVGAVPYRDTGVEYPVLTGGFMWLTAELTRGVHALVGSWSEVVLFGVLSAVLLAVCGLVVTAGTALTGRRRPYDAALFALSPLLVFHAFSNWDLLAMALASAALWAWSRDRPVGAGVLHRSGNGGEAVPGLPARAARGSSRCAPGGGRRSSGRRSPPRCPGSP